MKTVPLGSGLTCGPWQESEQTTRSRIIAEISERLIEWSELENRHSPFRWLSRIATLAGDPDSREAIWLYLRISTGDLGNITISYSDLGEKHHRTKQAEAQETARGLKVIRRHFPELARAVDSYLKNANARDENSTS